MQNSSTFRSILMELSYSIIFLLLFYLHFFFFWNLMYFGFNERIFLLITIAICNFVLSCILSIIVIYIIIMIEQIVLYKLLKICYFIDYKKNLLELIFFILTKILSISILCSYIIFIYQNIANFWFWELFFNNSFFDKKILYFLVFFDRIGKINFLYDL